MSGKDLIVKKWTPRVLLESLKYGFRAWIGISGSQLTLNDVVFSNIKTVKKTIGAPGVAGCDFNFSSDVEADRAIDLGSIIPALANVMMAKTHTLSGFSSKSIAIATVSLTDDVATITTATSHGITSETADVNLTGMEEEDLNGSFEATVINPSTFTIPLEHDDILEVEVTEGMVTPVLSLVASVETGVEASTEPPPIEEIDTIRVMQPESIPSASASNVYFVFQSNLSWANVTAGEVAVFVTYIEAI